MYVQVYIDLRGFSSDPRWVVGLVSEERAPGKTHQLGLAGGNVIYDFDGLLFRKGLQGCSANIALSAKG